MSTINHTTKAALLLSMLLALNYPMGLHDLCLDSTAASYFKPSHESPGVADLKPHSYVAGVATVHPDAGQPVYRDAPGHIS